MFLVNAFSSFFPNDLILSFYRAYLYASAISCKASASSDIIFPSIEALYRFILSFVILVAGHI